MMREMASRRTGMEDWGHRGQLAWLALLDQGTHGASRVSARVPRAHEPLPPHCVLSAPDVMCTRGGVHEHNPSTVFASAPQPWS
jgi:hypothetical protein